MDPLLKLIIIALLSYLLGSIPTAWIISKKFFGFDIRERGSGNVGSTNTFRLLGWKWGLVVQIIDIAKGAVAVLVLPYLFGSGITFPANTWFQDITIVKMIAGVFAVIGHIFPVSIGFRGGKGINTTAGMLIGIAPVDFAIALFFFILAVIFSGYISLGSIISAIVLPSSLVFRYNILHAHIPGYDYIVYFFIGITALLIFQHRKNIIRILKGTENRFPKLHLIKCSCRKT